MLQQSSARNWNATIQKNIAYGEFNAVLFKMLAFVNLALNSLVVCL